MTASRQRMDSAPSGAKRDRQPPSAPRGSALNGPRQSPGESPAASGRHADSARPTARGTPNTPGGHFSERQPSTTWRYQLADNLIALRQAKGWTQQALADRCGCARAYISSVEQGRRNLTLALLQMLADALGCAASDLVAGCTGGPGGQHGPAGGSECPHAVGPGERQ